MSPIALCRLISASAMRHNAGDSLPGVVWAGCLLALCGSITLGSSHSDGTGNIGSGLATGDLLLVGAAIMWSIETVRCGSSLVQVRQQ